MNPKVLVLAICVEALIYLLLYNLHDCNFKIIDDRFFDYSFLFCMSMDLYF